MTSECKTSPQKRGDRVQDERNKRFTFESGIDAVVGHRPITIPSNPSNPSNPSRQRAYVMQTKLIFLLCPLTRL